MIRFTARSAIREQEFHRCHGRIRQIRHAGRDHPQASSANQVTPCRHFPVVVLDRKDIVALGKQLGHVNRRWLFQLVDHSPSMGNGLPLTDLPYGVVRNDLRNAFDGRSSTTKSFSYEASPFQFLAPSRRPSCRPNRAHACRKATWTLA